MLAAQLSQYGGSVVGMPALQVTRAGNGLLMINDGVTWAFRVHRHCPVGTTVQVGVIEERPAWRIGSLARVCEVEV